MMIKKNILVTFCLCSMCMLSWGCGSGGGTIVIGSVEEQNGDFGPGESGTEDLTEEEEPAGGGQETLIRVYVCGAVANPGVVAVPEGSRVEDALRAAGGFNEDARQTAVNLADWVLDGQMLYFPTQQEEMDSPGFGGEAGLVDINTADAALLCTLPGIGEGRAADIISYREKNGRFASCEDIMKVPGIKTSVYEKIYDKITVK